MLLLAAAEQAGDLRVVLSAAQLLGIAADALDGAEQVELVSVEDDRVVFRHPLVRSAVYGGATFLQRRAANQALAAVLTDAQDTDRRAWQLASAAVGPDDALAADMAAAAERALSRGGHAAAATAYERAAALTSAAEPRAGRRSPRPVPPGRRVKPTEPGVCWTGPGHSPLLRSYGPASTRCEGKIEFAWAHRWPRMQA